MSATNETIAKPDLDEYKHIIRTFYLDLKNLRNRKTLHRFDESETSADILVDQIVGDGLIEDYGIAVLGAPNTESRDVKVTFTIMSESAHKRILADMDREVAAGNAKPIYTNVTLWYSEADWEIGNPSEWLVNIPLSEPAFRDLAESIRNKTVKSLKIGLDLTRIYSKDHYAPPSCRVNWFLRPGEGFMSPESLGRLTVFVLESHSSSLAIDDDSADANDDTGIGAEFSVPNQSVALEIAKLEQTIRRAGWYVFGALLLLLIFGRR